jgi:LuxR family maltose regulon positive regulatory protein
MPEVICDQDAARVRYWLATNQHSTASQWAQEWEKRVKTGVVFSIPNEQNEITLARVQVAEGKLESALMNLDQLAIAAENGGRIGHLIEIRNLQALAFQARGDSGMALIILQKSLALAEPEGYIRMFVDEGEPMQEMLRNYVRSSPSVHLAYAQRLLVVFTGIDQSASSRDQTSILVELLTAREKEILQLMAEGLSNNQIAEKLILAEGTIKFYVHSVLEKLGVHNRTQAVMEAKKIKII